MARRSCLTTLAASTAACMGAIVCGGRALGCGRESLGSLFMSH